MEKFSKSNFYSKNIFVSTLLSHPARNVEKCKLKLFPDDTSFYFVGQQDEIEEHLNEDLDIFHKYLENGSADQSDIWHTCLIDEKLHLKFSFRSVVLPDLLPS